MEQHPAAAYVEVPQSEQSVPKHPPDSTAKPGWRNSYTQITAACIVHLLIIQVGVNMAFSAILIPQLKLPDSDIHLEEGQDTWIASLVTISLPIGSLMSGPLMDRLGRRNVSLFICIPYLVSWILIYWSYDVVWLYVGRVLAGAAGGFSSVAIFYTSETTNPLWRPMLLGFNSAFSSVGILLTSIFGSWFYWRTIAVIFSILTAIIFVLVLFLPESPHWLLAFHNGTHDLNRVSEARKSMKWLNRNKFQAEKEFNQLLITYRTGHSVSATKNEPLKEKLRSLKSPEIYKPIILLIFIFLFQQCSGSYVIIFYAVQLFKDLGGSFGFLDEYGAMVAMGLLRLIMAIVSLILSLKCGRRTLCIISGTGMGVSMLSAAAYIQFSKSENNLPALVFVLLFVCFAAIGWQIIPWSLTGELLPTRMRAVVGGVMISYAYLLMFISVKTFPSLQSAIRLEGIFLLYGLISLASSAFIWKYLPETFGKTLTEIELYFK